MTSVPDARRAAVLTRQPAPHDARRPRASPRGSRASARRSCRRIPRRPSRPTATCARRAHGPGSQPADVVAVVTMTGGASAPSSSVDADVDDRDLARRASGRARTRAPGLRAANVTVRVGPHRRARHRAGEPVDPRGDVDRDHRARPAGELLGDPRGVVARGRRGSRCRTSRRPRRRPRPSARVNRAPVDAVRELEHASPACPTLEHRGGDEAVAAVVALAAHDHDPAPVGAPERAPHRPTRPRARPAPSAPRPACRPRSCAASAPPIASGVRTGSTRLSPTAITTAIAVASVCVSDTCQLATPRASASCGGRAVQRERRRAASSSRTTSTSRNANFAEADAERLHHRFLGREPRRQARHRVVLAGTRTPARRR